jgi:hypothetical protein
MSATVLKLEELKAELRRKRGCERGPIGACQTRPAPRDRPDFEYHADRLAAGVDEPSSTGRFAFDEAAQIRMAHWLAQWGPVLVLAAVIAWLGWLLIG